MSAYLNAPPVSAVAYLVAGSATTLTVDGLGAGGWFEFQLADGTRAWEGSETDGTLVLALTVEDVDGLLAAGVSRVRVTSVEDVIVAAGPVRRRDGWSGDCQPLQTIARVIAGAPGVGIESITGDAGQIIVRLTDGTEVPLPLPEPVPGVGVASIVSNGDGTATGTLTDGSTSLLELPKGDPGQDSTEPGPAGRGVASITDDDRDGVATVTYSDGTTGDLPLPKGEKGDDGPPLAVAWEGTRLIVGDAAPVDLKGQPGAPGSPGAVPTATDYLLVGPGRPDVPATTGGIITGAEPVGCEYRSTDGAAVGAWVWRKRPTGWAVTDGDTGLRKLSPLDAGGAAFIRRSGDYVYFNWGGSPTDTNKLLLWEVIAGFRTNHKMADGNGGWYSRSPISNENSLKTSGWIGYGHGRGTHVVWIHADSRASLKGGMSWQAYSDPWPTTLPGSPA